MNPEQHTADNVAKAEAVLFVEGGTLSKRKLASLLGIDIQALKEVTNTLSANLAHRTLRLVETETEVSLAAAPEVSAVIQSAYEGEWSKEIGDAGLEVVSILLYNGASTRSTIDYIRGVNTSSTVRTLLSRGLIERASNPHDSREYLYRPTTELLAYLGVENSNELPEYDKIASELATFGNTQKNTEGPFTSDYAESNTQQSE